MLACLNEVIGIDSARLGLGLLQLQLGEVDLCSLFLESSDAQRKRLNPSFGRDPVSFLSRSTLKGESW